jgi:ligand-binding sensor domain-containing protein
MVKEKAKNTRKSCFGTFLLIILICIALVGAALIVIPRVTGMSLTRMKNAAFSWLESVGIPTNKLRTMEIPFLDRGTSFTDLPQARDTVMDLSGTWTVYLNPNGAGDLVYGEGILWALPAQGQGIVAWNVQTGENQHYTTFDGLAANRINQLALDGSGDLVAATNDAGIIYIDEGYWKVIDRPGIVRVLLSDGQGGTWFTNTSGNVLSRFDGENWEDYELSKDPGVSRITRAMACSDGRLYFQGDQIIRYMDGSIKAMEFGTDNQAGSLRLMACSSDGNAYLVDSSSRVFIEKDDQLVDGPPVKSVDGKIDLAVTGGKGAVIFSTMEGSGDEPYGLYQLLNDQVTRLPYAGSRISALEVSEDGFIWAANENAIVQIKKGKLDKELSDPGNNAPGKIYEICTDPDGSIWVAGGSIYHFVDGEWSRLSQIEEVGVLDVRGCAVPGELTWFLGQTDPPRLISYKNDKWTVFSIDKEVGEVVYDLSAGAGKVAISTDKGIMTFDENSSETMMLVNWTIPGLPARLAVDTDGMVWVFVPGSGVFGLTVDRLVPVFSNDQRFNVIDMVDSGEKMYIANVDGINIFEEERFNRINGSPMNITDLAYAEDSLWVATATLGAWEFEEGWVAHLAPDLSALAGPRINHIALDGGQAVWLDVDGGLFRYQPGPAYRESLPFDPLLLETMDEGWEIYYFPLMFN